MKISEALRGVKLIAFDTSPFIYYTEDSPAYVDKMDVIFDLIYADKTQIITSIITLTEVLVKPLRIGDIVVESKYRTLFSSTGKIQLQLVDRAVAERAAGTALALGCSTGREKAAAALSRLRTGLSGISRRSRDGLH